MLLVIIAMLMGLNLKRSEKNVQRAHIVLKGVHYLLFVPKEKLGLLQAVKQLVIALIAQLVRIVLQETQSLLIAQEDIIVLLCQVNRHTVQ